MCVCLSVCVSVFLFRFYGLYLVYYGSELGENVGTSVRLIVLNFHKNRFGFDVIMTSFPFLKLFLSEATLLKGKQLCAKGNNYDAPDCDTSDSDLVEKYKQNKMLTQRRRSTKLISLDVF